MSKGIRLLGRERPGREKARTTRPNIAQHTILNAFIPFVPTSPDIRGNDLPIASARDTCQWIQDIQVRALVLKPQAP
jgi:hypothetical protein